MHTIQQPDYFMHAPALNNNYLLCGPLFACTFTFTIHGQWTWNMNMLVHDDDMLVVVVVAFATCRSIPLILDIDVAQEAWRKQS